MTVLGSEDCSGNMEADESEGVKALLSEHAESIIAVNTIIHRTFFISITTSLVKHLIPTSHPGNEDELHNMPFYKLLRFLPKKKHNTK